MTRYAAHPTTYKGVLFRSRLEARWACYFDQRGWTWVYEPFDLHGYSPDFSLVHDTAKGVLIEVKPATKLGQLSAPIGKIMRAGWTGPWMVVGADPDICMVGHGRHGGHRRYLGTEAPDAWATACNITQWKPAEKPSPPCVKCGKPDHFLHKLVCKPGT